MVAVIGGAAARLFVVDPGEEAVGRPRRSRLVELEGMIQPGHRARDREQFSESRPGLRQGGSQAATGHGVDDHREGNRAEAERHFVADVLTEIRNKAAARRLDQVIVAAGPEVLGYARAERHRLGDIEVIELPKQLTGLSCSQLHDRLVGDGLLRW